MSSIASSLGATAAALLLAAAAHAGLVASYELGAGASTSSLQFDFENGNSYLYTIHWDGPTTGRDLFDIVGAAQPGFFAADIVTFPFGDALYGLAIGADANAGFGTPPAYLDYWHYWLRDGAADAWRSAMVGFADRLVADGSWDGWVFGGDGAPASVPAPSALAALAVAALGRRRRRTA